MVTAVAAPFPDNEGDDQESEIIREVLTQGRGMLAQALLNLLVLRQVNELYAFQQYLLWVDFQRWRQQNKDFTAGS